MDKEQSHSRIENIRSRINKLLKERNSSYELQSDLFAKQQMLMQDTMQHFLAVIQEIKGTNEKLRAQNEKLSSIRRSLEIERGQYADLFEHAPGGYLVTDLNGIIHDANQAAVKLLGWTRPNLAGHLFVKFIPLRDRGIYRNKLSKLQNLAKTQRQEDPDPSNGEWEIHIQPERGPEIDVAITVTLAQQINPSSINGDTIQKQDVLRWLIRDVTERKHMERARKELLNRLVTVQEDERRRISLELHDQVGQTLTALMLGLKRLQDNIPNNEQTISTLKQLQQMTDEISQEIHSLARELRPSSLDDLGLPAALANYAEEWSERNHIQVDYQIMGERDAQFSRDTVTCIYRIVTEALTNVLKHTHAQHISLILDTWPGEELTIVEDDGQGFDVDSILTGKGGERRLGITGMKERAELLGGKFNIESAPGKGTTIIVRIPLEENGKKNGKR